MADMILVSFCSSSENSPFKLWSSLFSLFGFTSLLLPSSSCQLSRLTSALPVSSLEHPVSSQNESNLMTSYALLMREMLFSLTVRSRVLMYLQHTTTVSILGQSIKSKRRNMLNYDNNHFWKT